MKKPTKRVLALALVALMACPMTAAWANTATITKVVVRDTTGENVLWTYEGEALATATITADSSNLVDVTVQITDDSDAAAPVGGVASTFLSHLDGAEELSNENIQFVDQTTTDATTGTATYTFRPRASLAEGSYLAKSGGEGVTAAASKQYTVGTADVQWTLEATNNNVESGSTDALVYNFTLPANASMPGALTAVTINDTAATYEYDAEAKTLSLTDYPNTDADTYTVKASASGYADATATYVVQGAASAPEVEVDETDTETVETAIDTALDAVVKAKPVVDEAAKTVSVPAAAAPIEGAEKTYEVIYSIDAAADSGVVLADNKITWTYSDEGRFAERVKVTVKVNDTVAETKDIYFIKPGTTVSFGNATAIADGTACAFSTQEGLATVDDTAALELRAKALNIVFNGVEAESVASWNDTLDYDRNGTVTLAEYYIIKRMLDERATSPVHDVYNVDKVAGSRPPAQ